MIDLHDAFTFPRKRLCINVQKITVEGICVGKKSKKFLISLTLVCIALVYFIYCVDVLSFSQVTTLYIDPDNITVNVGQNFTVEIKVSNVSDLYGWEFKLKWNPNLMNLVDIIEGSFLKQNGDTFFAKKVNNSEGFIIVDCTLLGNITGVSGGGTLALAQFHAKVQGEGMITLSETTLINSYEQTIPHIVHNGKAYAKPETVDVLSLLKSNIHIIVLIILIIGTISAIAYFAKFRKPSKKIDVTSAFQDDEEKIIAMLKNAGGRLPQSILSDQCGFSRSKTSKILKSMEKKGKIIREEKGREKIVILTKDKSEKR